MISKNVYDTIQEQLKLGITQTRISKNLGMSQSSISRYAKMSEEEFMRASQSARANGYDYDIYRKDMIELFKKFPDIRFTAMINRLKIRYPNMKYQYAPIRRYYKNLRNELGIITYEDNKKSYNIPSRNKVVQTPPPGYEAQTDFGVFNAKDMYGKPRKIYIFVMTMSYSNLLFGYCQAEPFTTETACMAHRKAFEFFGGRPQTIVYDNDVVYVQAHNYGDPILTTSFEKFIEEMGYGARFCKPAQPNSKAKVEIGVKFIKQFFLEGKEYCGIDSLNSELLFWLDTVWNSRTSERKGVSPHDLFEDEAHLLVKVPKYNPERTIFAAHGDNLIHYKFNTYELPMYKVKQGTRVKVIDEGETVAFLLADTDEFLCRHEKCTGRGMNITLPDKDITFNRASIDSLLLRFRGNKTVEEFIRIGREKQLRYFVLLCKRIVATTRLIPDNIVIDAIHHMINHDRLSVKEYMSYIDYRGYANVVYRKLQDHSRAKYQPRIKEIAYEYALKQSTAQHKALDEDTEP